MSSVESLLEKFVTHLFRGNLCGVVLIPGEHASAARFPSGANSDELINWYRDRASDVLNEVKRLRDQTAKENVLWNALATDSKGVVLEMGPGDAYYLVTTKYPPYATGRGATYWEALVNCAKAVLSGAGTPGGVHYALEKLPFYDELKPEPPPVPKLPRICIVNVEESFADDLSELLNSVGYSVRGPFTRFDRPGVVLQVSGDLLPDWCERRYDEEPYAQATIEAVWYARDAYKTLYGSDNRDHIQEYRPTVRELVFKDRTTTVRRFT